MDNLKKLLSTIVLFLMVSAPLHAEPGSALWSVDIGGNIGSSAAYDHTNGQLYVGSADKRLYALDNVGNVLWTFATQGYIAAAPVVSADGAIVYITSYDHHVYAIDTQSGIELWRFNTGDIVYASVAIDQNNHLYIGSRNGIFYALDGTTGAEQWQLALGSVIGSSAAIEHNGYVYVGAADGYLYALDPSALQVNPSAGWVWRAFTGGGVSSPVIDFDGHIYVGSHDYSIYSFDGDTGAQRWSTTLGGRITSSPVIDAQGNLYVSTFDNGALNALAPSGSLIWSLPLSNSSEPMYSSPALANDGTVFVGAFDGVIRAIDPSAYSASNTPNDPQSLVVWSTQLGSPAVSSPLIDNTGTVYISAQNNYFYAIESNITGAANSAWPLLGKNANRNALQVNTDSDGDGLSDNRDPFPSDPDNGLNHSAWAACSGEWHFCSPPAPAFVRYGAAGQYAYAYVTDTIHCMNPVFGDPVPGVLKSCEYLLSDQDDFDGDGVVDRVDAFPEDSTETLDSDQDGTGNNADPFPYDPDNNIAGGWVSCGDEWTTCTVPVPAEVRYGANGQYTTQQVETAIACTNSAFGGDPLSGVFKACSYSLSSTADFDGDGVVDSLDAFPADKSESADSDYDGIGDNGDLFPQDATNNPNANWVHCANDNAVCQLPSSSIVRYGAGSQYLFKVVTDSITCSASVFGDPAPNLAKTCSYMLQDTDGDGLLDNNDPFPTDPENGIDDAGWTACAREWHFCSPPVPAYVRYGANGQYAYQYTDDTIHCMNPVFGDPAPGVVKYCDYLLSDIDDFDGDGVVDSVDAFPADNTEALDSDKDGIGNNADPFPYDADNNVAGGWVFCGNEWSSCTVPVPAEVRYGANGQYATQQVQDTIACTNSAFGGDPISGVLKACSYSLSSTADFDGDGVVDSLDDFPADRTESVDSDNDGIGDNSDVFPNDPTNNPNANWIHCANDNALCEVPSRALVRYGAGSQYQFAVVIGAVHCSASVFGNPAPNQTRACSYIVIDPVVSSSAAIAGNLSASPVVTTLANTVSDSQFNNGNPERIRSELMGSPSYMLLSPVRKTLNGADVSIDYMVHEPVVSPKGIVLLIAGGQLDAELSVDTDNNILSVGDDFLVRSAHLFAAQGYKVVTMSHPSDRADDVGNDTNGYVYDYYRNSMRHAVDVSTIINTENQNGLPVFISGTDRGAISAMALNTMANAIDLTSPITSGVYVPINSAHFDFNNASRNIYIAWHVNDACSVSTPTGAENLRDELIAAGVNIQANAFAGGFDNPAQTNPCQNDTVHSFFGIESGVVEKITAWYDSLLATLPQTRPTADAMTLATGTTAIDLSVLSAGEGPLTYSLPFTTSSLGGSLTLSHGVVSYSPPANSIATEDSFVYIVKDRNGGISHNVVTIPLQ